MIQKRDLEQAFSAPNLWTLPQLLFPPFENEEIEFGKSVALPRFPHEAFGDWKLSSVLPSYRILVASDFLIKTTCEEVGQRKITVLF